MVLGISGGIDSTVVAAICHEVSKQTGIPLIGRSLPIKNKNDEFSVSKLVGNAFCDDFKVVNLSYMCQHVIQAIKKSMSLTPTDGLGISNSDLDQIGAKSYYDVDRVLQTLTCKASPENDKLQDELTAELGPDVVGKITERRFKSRFKRLVSPIIVPREMYD